MIETPPVVADDPHPPRWLAWTALALLSMAALLSFIDRFVLSLLITPIKTSLGLSDTEIGLLMGPAFAVCFAVFGVPIGWLADRANRRGIVAAGIATWSVMTAACGLATSFAGLFTARIGVGLCEAALNPCVVSLVSDYFPRALRSRAIGLYMAGAFLGAGGAYIVGGQAVAIIQQWPPVALPIIGVLLPWQTAFVVVALPGLVLAGAMLLVPEPPRLAVGPTAAPPPLAVVRHVAAHAKAYAGVFLGMAGTTAISGSSFWSPVLFERAWGWDVDRTGLAIGIIILATGIPGANLGGWLADRWTRRGRSDGPLLTCLVGSAVMLPGFVLYPLMPSGEWAAAWLSLAFFGLAVGTGVSPNAVAAVSPAKFKAQIAALFFMTINLLGLFLGPPLVGALADRMAGADGIRYALSISYAGFGVATIAVLWWGLAAFRAMASVVAREEP